VAGTGNDMVFGGMGKALPKYFLVIGIWLVMIVGGSPKLNRDVDVLERIIRKSESKRWSSHHNGLDARVCNPCAWRNLIAQMRGIHLCFFQSLAEVMAGMSLAIGTNSMEIRNTARSNEHGEAAIGVPERADPMCGQPFMLRPIVEHVAYEGTELIGASPKLQHLALVVVGVASVANGRSYETGMS